MRCKFLLLAPAVAIPAAGVAVASLDVFSIPTSRFGDPQRGNRRIAEVGSIEAAAWGGWKSGDSNAVTTTWAFESPTKRHGGRVLESARASATSSSATSVSHAYGRDQRSIASAVQVSEDSEMGNHYCILRGSRAVQALHKRNHTMAPHSLLRCGPAEGPCWGLSCSPSWRASSSSPTGGRPTT